MAGELIDAEWQIEINGLLMGPDTDYRLRRGYPTGMGQRAKPNDTPLGHADGSYGGPDYREIRVITAAFYIPESADDPWDALDDALEAWAPSTTDVELHVNLPSGHVFLVGRPRGLDVVFGKAGVDHIELLAEFHALDPNAQPYVGST